ncbi:MAG: lamin tail domain-containing protein, partial [Sedimentisphaerales bacterium]|nr:lamin tail domain-containing protein [Sedimentisphaerales bacterium]
QTIAHQYNYPAQYGSMSYGIASPDTQAPTNLELIPPGTTAFAFVPADDTLALSWVQTGFDTTGWVSGTTGVGYERSEGSANNFTSLIGLNVNSNMSSNTSAYIRVPFNVTDLTGLRDLVLSMKYDDGFVAYLNGVKVAWANAPDPLVWNSNASGFHDDAAAVSYQEFVLSPEAVEYLHVGENVLAIHGLNENTGSSDFIIMPRLTCTQDQNVSIAMQNVAYFPAPTPGVRNSAGQINLGPQVRDVTENPVPVNADQNLVITAWVAATSQPVAQVELAYVVGYNDEVVIPMSDNGQGPDALAADSVYTAIIPASAYNPGDMVRWCVLAADTQGGSTREPLYLLTENSPRYYGTVINNTGINTNLTVLHCFTQNPYAANTDAGTRCSVYYLGEFYDNVFIRDRGGFSTDGNKIEFNDGRHFRFDPAYERVDEINLNGSGYDPTYIRPTLAFETYEQAGIASSLAYPIHVRLNKSFLGVRVFIEQPDSHLLRRVGLDDNGAFYKVYNNLGYNTGNVEPDRKITRLYEDSSDLYALRQGIDPSNPDRNIFLFDNVNLPAVISYMAANTLVHENDAVEKNFFLYRDTENTGEWQFIPWDKDLTFGINMGVDGIATNQDWPADLQRSPSHPFFGSVRHQKSDNKWNRLVDAVVADPVARQMYVRRLRTLMDSQLQPSNTPASSLKYEARVDELVALLTPELYNANYQTNINLLKNTYLPGRRHHLYVNHLVGSTWPDDPAQIPQAQPNLFWLQIGAIEYNPTSWNQGEEYIEILNPNSFAADISGWTVTGAVEHTFPGGTVIPANGKMYITPDALAFRSRASSPKGGEHLFVQGNYKGHLSNWGETINIIHPKGNVLATKTYVGNPTAVQRYLRISEIMYNPLDSTDPLYENSDYEYLELVNAGPTALLLDGVVFTKGISYSFPAGTELAAGEYILLVKNLAAFNSRYSVDPTVRIFTGYEGNLSNAGEIIAFDDQTNSSVLDFEYKDNWYDITDGQGFSLTFAAALDGLPELWSQKGSWRASTFSGGSPGSPEQGLATDSIVINELMSHSHASQPDWIELYNKTGQNINIGGWFLTDDNTDFTTIRKYEIPANTVIAGHGYLLFSQDTSFGSSSQPESKRFGLSEAGETVYLFSGQNGDVTGYYQTQQKFDASETGISFGRFEKASLSNGYDFVRMATATPLAANSSPIIPGIVITELMYDPSAGTDSEYVELYNRSDSAITLMTEVSTEAVEGVVTIEYLPWRIEGTGYEFPNNVTLAAGERIVVAKKPATFATTYAGIVPAGTRVFGPYSGKLSNEGEDIQLQIPGDQEYGKSRIYIPIEKVEYSDSSPWPTNLGASGYSLARIYTMTYADDPVNWRGATPSPGM